MATNPAAAAWLQLGLGTDQARAAVIHHRLASLYHHSYRQLLEENINTRDRNNKMKLADLQYVKATNIFLGLDRISQTIRTVLERAGLLEASLTTLKTEVGRYKAHLQVLDIIMETKPLLGKIINREEKLLDTGEMEEEEKMVGTILSRLQATLLALIRTGGKRGKNFRY